MQMPNAASWDGAASGDAINTFAPLSDGNQVYTMHNDDASALPFFGTEPFDPFPIAGWPSLPPDAENMDAIIRSLFDDFIPNSGDVFQVQ